MVAAWGWGNQVEWIGRALGKPQRSPRLRRSRREHRWQAARPRGVTQVVASHILTACRWLDLMQADQAEQRPIGRVERLRRRAIVVIGTGRSRWLLAVVVFE